MLARDLFDEPVEVGRADPPPPRNRHLVNHFEEFRRALEHTSTHWDAKFNYELVGKLIADAWKKPDTEQQMKLVKPSRARQPPPKVG